MFRIISLFRVPLMTAAGGVGVAAYVNQKVEDLTPSWMKGFKFPKLDDIEFPNFDLPDFKFPPPIEEGQDTKAAGPIEEEQDKVEVPQIVQDEFVTKENIKEIVKQFKEEFKDNHLMDLTKKLIEIRNLLKNVETDSSIRLPSIVVVGSQSSGKSSVLEAIVGHEFLPKGSNMVTRRPIELTLINTPESDYEYSEFPQLQLGKITSFQKVQKTLTDLNMAVSDKECVSKKPIELKIYSKNIPDLTLVDLPGYIQVVNKNQPVELKEKITQLCEEYIQEPNIILAVCAADVDLANSEALRSSLRVDPLGLRTIGVVTKMDLVEPLIGNAILNVILILTKTTDYPLSLGYIGVVNKSNGDSKAMIRSEAAFFQKHSIYKPSSVGSDTLRLRLMQVLETHMSRSLESIVDKVGEELDESRYQFKVHYNDRKIIPEAYVSDSMDLLKTRFREFTKQFDKPIMREKIREMLERKMIQISQNIYWDNERIQELPSECALPLWDAKLSHASGLLTRSGVGKSTVDMVVGSIEEKIEEITSLGPWSFHLKAREKVQKYANDLLRSKYHQTIDQVENTIKPYKFEVDCTEQEWQDGKQYAVKALSQQIQKHEKELIEIKKQVGRKKLKQSIRYVEYLDKIKNTDIQPQRSDLPLELLDSAREALELKQKLYLLHFRQAAIKSRQCSSKVNKNCCPEVFLEVVAEKLSQTSSMFINIELLNEFFFQLPREVDNKLYYSLGREEIVAFCKENPSVKEHMRVQERNEILEEVMRKLRDLRRHS